jgi:hypothetical protein
MMEGEAGTGSYEASTAFQIAGEPQSIQNELIFVDTAEQFYANDRDNDRFEVFEAKYRPGSRLGSCSIRSFRYFEERTTVRFIDGGNSCYRLVTEDRPGASAIQGPV